MYRTQILTFLILFIVLSGCRNNTNSDRQLQVSDTGKMPLELLNKEILLDASNPNLYHTRAIFYLSDHQFDKALKDINQAILLDSLKSVYFVTLSDIYLMMGQPQNSRDVLIRAMNINPDDTDARLKLAKLYLIMKDYRNCYEMVRQLLLIDNNIASAYFTRAIGLLEQGDTNRAVADLMQAVDKNQDYYEAYLQLGDLYAIKKDPLAEAYLKNALSIRPKSLEALYMLGMYYQETSEYKKAIEIYKNLAKIDSSFREAPYNIGYIYLVYLNDFNQAIPYFTESLKKDPGYYQAYFNRGYAYELAGEVKKATEDYQRALKIKVNYDKAIEGLNRIDKLKIRK